MTAAARKGDLPAVVRQDRSNDGHEGCRRERSERGIEDTERPEQQVGAQLKALELAHPNLVLPAPDREGRHLRRDHARPVDDACDAVAGPQAEYRGGVREDGRTDYGRQHGERALAERRDIAHSCSPPGIVPEPTCVASVYASGLSPA